LYIINEARANSTNLPPLNTNKIFGQLLMIHSNEEFETSTWTSPLMKVVGPLLIETTTENVLKPELKAWIEDENLPVVYANLGYINVLNTEELEFILRGLTSNDWRVVWSMRDDVKNYLEQNKNITFPDSVSLLGQIPLRGILSHSMVKLFVTGGDQSHMYESIHAGKPTVCMPLFPDRATNCKKMENDHVGVTLTRAQFTPKKLKETIKKVLGDKSYKTATVELSKYIDLQGPSEAADFIEEIEENGYEHLIPHYYQLPFYQQWNLDIIVIAILLVFITFKFVKTMFRCCCYCCKKQNKVKKE